jgi:2-aminoadipate transaminase
MLQAIRQHFPQEVTVTDPQGGLFTWARFPAGFDATAFLRDHALPKARVAYVPGGTFFATTPQPNHARINFSSPSEDRIRDGIAALGQCLKDHMTCP